MEKWRSNSFGERDKKPVGVVPNAIKKFMLDQKAHPAGAVASAQSNPVLEAPVIAPQLAAAVAPNNVNSQVRSPVAAAPKVLPQPIVLAKKPGTPEPLSLKKNEVASGPKILLASPQAPGLTALSTSLKDAVTAAKSSVDALKASGNLGASNLINPFQKGVDAPSDSIKNALVAAFDSMGGLNPILNDPNERKLFMGTKKKRSMERRRRSRMQKRRRSMESAGTQRESAVIKHDRKHRRSMEDVQPRTYYKDLRRSLEGKRARHKVAHHKRDTSDKIKSAKAIERSHMGMPITSIQQGPKLMDKIRDMSRVIATP